MSGAWAVYVLLIGALLAVAAAAIESAVRRLRMPTRWVWSSALVLLAVLAALAPLRGRRVPERFVELPVQTTPWKVAQTPTVAGRLARVRTQIAAREQAVVVMLAREVSGSAQRALAIGWLSATLLVMALIIGVNAVMMHRRSRWPRAHLHGASVRITSDVGPAVVGIAPPEIVVPAWLLERSDEEQRLAVAHEGEHVAARDNLLLAGGWLVASLLPWHPAAWWMLSRMRLAIELDCDARVLRRGIAPRSYGQMLIDIADHCSGQRVMALALADTTSHLERRLLAMKSSRTPLARTRAALLGATGMLAILAACEAKMPTSAEIEGADVASFEKKATQAKLVEERVGVPTAYVVDGMEVTADVAHKLAATEVASVGISKSKTGNLIAITTQAKSVLLERTMKPGVVEVPGVKIAADTFTMLPSKTSFNGIFVIDGRQVGEAEFTQLKLNPSRIESVEVFKGAAAARLLSDPRAANGVISITTKK